MSKPANKPLNFGVFVTPFHPVCQSPTAALEYDLERTVALDRLGYDEVWFGEHPLGSISTSVDDIPQLLVQGSPMVPAVNQPPAERFPGEFVSRRGGDRRCRRRTYRAF